MKDKLHIAFIWWWGRAAEIYPNWRDGLRAAIEILAQTHQVDVYLGEELPRDEYDAILFWGDSNCPFFEHMGKYKGKKGIFLTTDPHNMDNLKKLDAVYCESTPVYEAVKAQGGKAIKAFGTDTNFYQPSDLTLVLKDIEFFYPATFSLWKKQSSIAHLGPRLTCIGTVQPDGQEELQACLKQGVQVQEGYFSPSHIKDCYMRAKHVLIPAIHGSERTCLEAMSMDIVPQVNPDNKRTISYVEEYIHSGCATPRDFVVMNYSAQRYAEAILRGIV